MQTTLFGVHSKRPFLAGADLSEDGQYRFSLWRIFDAAKPMVLFIGLNPSTADATHDDATIRRCSRFAQDWGFGGFYMANLFCIRSTNPNRLWELSDPIGPRADEWLDVLAAKCAQVVFAWGTYGYFMGRDQAVIARFPDAYCLGHSKDKHPLHPLYLPSGTQLHRFNPLSDEELFARYAADCEIVLAEKTRGITQSDHLRLPRLRDCYDRGYSQQEACFYYISTLLPD